jgi:hypothetical protein
LTAVPSTYEVPVSGVVPLTGVPAVDTGDEVPRKTR